MNRIIEKTVLISSVVLLAGAASASEIYKHVDADGNVTYGDRPTGAPAEQRMNIVSRTTDPAEVQASVDRTLELEEELEQRRDERETAKAEAAEEAREAADRASKCAENQQRLTKYNESRRLYREDANGERVYLDDGEREEAKQHVRDLISEFCN